MAATRERIGRPTQFHGVPLEERAFDAQGNRLPWALEYPDDHPNARVLKRQPEEKGSFGKATRRKGSSRVSRTQTPAKKENPTLDGFEAALKFDVANDSHKKLSSTGAAVPEHQHSVTAKEPTQLILYGYSADTQWAALHFYEQVSWGMICEDYDREPPAERKRFYSGLESTSSARRPLTKEEKALAMRYHGGVHWIKVTLDSREAAERALAASPHALQGHWVYATAFKGHGPEADEPILVREEDRSQSLLGIAKPAPQHKSATLGSASAPMTPRSPLQQRATTLPRSFVTRETSQDGQSVDSTNTASSATATTVDAGALRKRDTASTKVQSVGQTEQLATTDGARFTHFPEEAKTVLKPASEALLPQISWSERLVQQLTRVGWIPGDMIGTVVPRLENGEFDWANASFYWKLFYWIDCTLGTDLCGLKEN